MRRVNLGNIKRVNRVYGQVNMVLVEGSKQTQIVNLPTMRAMFSEMLPLGQLTRQSTVDLLRYLDGRFLCINGIYHDIR